ncbi:MAG: ParB/RepB/Spo0J family partition protein [Rickettsiales bacterium]|jgi:ParB family chromosome partitioning protein|nr:ParB/RepB/Spo0J family partition protein [Rickettsiales bacterium]
MSKFGLGRGLADLKAEMGQMSEISVLSGGERIVVRHLPIESIAPNPDQPRKIFTPDELGDLAASIKEKGVLQPILVRVSAGGDRQYEIVAGERRWRAAKMAGLSDIPALVKTLSDENSMEIALIENVQRENLNAIEEAAAYRNLMEKCGYEFGDVVRLIGKSEGYIRNIMRLEALPDSVKKMVKDGALTASHARALTVAENPAELAERIISGKMSVQDTEKLVKSAPRSSKSRCFRPDLMPKDQIARLEQQIEKALGAPTQLRMRKAGAGDVIVRFGNKLQMEEVIKKLTGN